MSVSASTALIRLAGVMLAGLTITGCGQTGPPRATALPADRMVFMVMSSGGMVPALLYALQSPSLVVYGDGRVVTLSAGVVPELIPARYNVARVDVAAVENFVASADRGGVISSATDFGTPRVTDLDTTTVLLDAGAGPQQVRVYALDEQFDRDLSPVQRETRARLRTLIDAAGQLATGAATAAYIPDRVAVYEPMSGAGDEPATTAWPGPPPESFMVAVRARRSTACGELSGEPARVAYRAALANPGARWLVDGTTRVLAVNSLPLPGACS